MSVYYQQILQVFTWRGVVAVLICVVLMCGWAESYWRCSTLILQWLLVWFSLAIRMIEVVNI